MNVLLPAFALLLALLPTAYADPVVLAQGNDDAHAETLAVSPGGNATCTTSTCVAVSLSHNATAGCHNETSCERNAPCDGFVCLAAAASPLGDAEAFASCTLFGQACVAVGVDRDAYLYACHGNLDNNGICLGI